MGENLINSLIESDNIAKERLEAFSKFKELGLPDKKSEAYRYFDVGKILKREYNFTKEEVSQVNRGKDIVIVDGILRELPQGLNFEMIDGFEFDKSHFDPLYYLGIALCSKIIKIDIKKDMKLKLVHIITKSKELIPYRVMFDIDKNVNVEVMETFDDNGVKDSFVLSGYDIWLGRDANATFIKEQTVKEGGFVSVLSHSMKVDANASLDFLRFDFGDGDALELFDVKLYKNSSFKANHLLYATNEAKRGTVSKIVHIGENSKSSQNAKNIISKKGRGIFDALIKVEQSAKWTKAYQNSKAILLDDDAYMISKPQLEICIDELEASHGSTTGQLNEDELFYLRSRGIELLDAKKMLIEAFANEMIDGIKSEEVRDRIHCAFEEAYYGKAQLNCIDTCHGCEDIILKEKS